MRNVPAWFASALLAIGSAAHGQTAPAGNEHPRSEAVSRAVDDFSSPFGQAEFPSPATPEAKRAFKEKVDLEPLRSVPLFHDGRVKILDTLARETVQRLAGRKDYVEGAGRQKVRFDPLFTLVDVMIDPGYYVEKPLLHVEYLPLRKAFVEAAFPGNAAEQERWLHLTRLSPRIVFQHGPAVQDRHDTQAPYRDALMRLAGAMELYQSSVHNLLVVPPAASDGAYQHLAVLADDSPARLAAAKLGAAWRAGDAAAANSAVRELAAAIDALPGVRYPEGRRDLELAYNRANAFEWGFWAYAAALVSLILAFGTGRRWLVALGIATLVAAIGLHAFGFVARCVIAERFAIQNQFESMTGLSLFGVIVGMGIMLLRRQWLFGAAAAGVGFLVLVTATQTAIPGRTIEREAAILNTSVLLKYHVTTVLVSYGLISLGFITSLFYLGTHYAARMRGGAPVGVAGGGTLAAAALGLDEHEPVGTARTLKDLDTAQMTVLQLAFWTLGVGILLGAWWADHSWGRWWAFDPKETWALVTWIIYLIVIHLRFATGPKRALVTAWLSVLGFFVMVWTYFGVNLVLPGLHAYA